MVLKDAYRILMDHREQRDFDDDVVDEALCMALASMLLIMRLKKDIEDYTSEGE